MFGSVRPLEPESVCSSTMILEIQSKINVCLSIISGRTLYTVAAIFLWQLCHPINKTPKRGSGV